MRFDAIVCLVLVLFFLGLLGTIGLAVEAWMRKHPQKADRRIDFVFNVKGNR